MVYYIVIMNDKITTVTAEKIYSAMSDAVVHKQNVEFLFENYKNPMATDPEVESEIEPTDPEYVMAIESLRASSEAVNTFLEEHGDVVDFMSETDMSDDDIRESFRFESDAERRLGPRDIPMLRSFVATLKEIESVVGADIKASEDLS